MKIKRKTFDRIKKWTIGILIVVGIFFVCYGYFVSDFFTIRNYQIHGLNDFQQREATNAIQSASSTRSFFVIPHNKVLSFSSKHIAGTLIAIFPDIQSIGVRPVGLHTLKLDVSMYEPLLRTDENTAITENGILFTTNKDIRSLPIITLASSTILEEELGGRIIKRIRDVDPLFLKESKAFEEKVSSVIFKVRTINLNTDGDVTFSNASGTSKILIQKGADMNKVWSTLLSAIDTDPLKSKLKSSKETLEYLDVRFGNKVFYKFKNKEAFEAPRAPVIIENYATSTVATTTLP